MEKGGENQSIEEVVSVWLAGVFALKRIFLHLNNQHQQIAVEGQIDTENLLLCFAAAGSKGGIKNNNESAAAKYRQWLRTLYRRCCFLCLEMLHSEDVRVRM